MRSYLFTLLLLFVAHALSAARPPNIVFILCDDLGYGDLGVTGHPYVKTPTIDKLAGEGLHIVNGYSSGAWCAPARYAIASGRYPAHYFNDTHEMDTGATNLYRVMNDAGYRTAHFGKWHLSGRQDQHPTPEMYGIDEDFIHNGNGEKWTPAERQAPHWRENSTRKYVDLTIDFIERSHQAGEPFFAFLSVYPPHSYIDPTPEMLEPYEDLEVDINDFENPLQREFLQWISEQGDLQSAMQSFCADVTELDKQIGRLMVAIEALGLSDDTLIIFTSDNGPAPVDGVTNLDSLAMRIKERPKLINNVGSAGPFRDRKISLHEGGVRVPLFVYWPGKVPSGVINTDTIFAGVDFLPTLASLVNGVAPDEIDGLEGLDGENLLYAFANKPVARSKPHFWQDRPSWTAVRDRQWKAHLQRGKFSLFNILEDPLESNNLAGSHPEIMEHCRNLIEDFKIKVSR